MEENTVFLAESPLKPTWSSEISRLRDMTIVGSVKASKSSKVQPCWEDIDSFLGGRQGGDNAVNNRQIEFIKKVEGVEMWKFTYSEDYEVMVFFV